MMHHVNIIFFSALCMLFSYDGKHYYTGSVDWIAPEAAVLCEDSQDSAEEYQQQSVMAVRVVKSMTYKVQRFALDLVTVARTF